MDKRGQFFLIAALVVVGILIGLSIVYTTTRTSEEEARIYDLSNEIYYEGSQVIDSGIFSGDEELIESRIDELIEDYSSLYPDSDITLLYGDGTGKTFECAESGDIGYGTASLAFCEPTSYTTESGISEETVWVKLEDEEYKFDLKPGENFFIVIQKESREGEQIVAT